MAEAQKMKTKALQGFIIGAGLGGLLGGITGLISAIGTPSRSGTALLTGTALGASAGGFAGGLIGGSLWTSGRPEAAAKLQLREERLNVYKKHVPTAEVHVYKEVTEEKRSFTIPVRHEEIVVDTRDKHGRKTIRIPIREERVEITKQPIDLADVDIYKQKYQTMKQIKEKLKHEHIHIEAAGDVEVVERE